MLLRAISYWSHILLLPASRLVSAAVLVNFQLAKSNRNCLLRSLNNSLAKVGACQLSAVSEADVDRRAWAGKAACEVLDWDMREWRAGLDRIEGKRSGLNKLRTYRRFKLKFQFEPHLSASIPVEWRHLLTRFRLGVAPLRIETGRWERRGLEVGIPADDRVCLACRLGVVEDEFHMVCVCPVYAGLRAELVSVAARVFDAFAGASMEFQFVLLMSNESDVVAAAVARFLKEAFDCRSLMLA
jgi:hypothetical protein